MIQDHLGNALCAPGTRGDDAVLRRAIDAHEAALLEFTRESAPLVWAGTLNGLGNALYQLGTRGDDAGLRRAVAAYEAALDELSRHDAPAARAGIEQNLARTRALLP